LWPAGVGIAVAAEWIGEPDLVVLDAITGLALVTLGLGSWSRRPASRAGPIMSAAGFAWFLGTVWGPALYLHRGFLGHLLVSYPRGALPARRDRMVVAGMYVYAAAYPLAGNDYFTIAFALALVVLGARRYAVASGPERRARLTALVAASAFGTVLTVGAASRLVGVADGLAVLAAYDAVVCLIAAALFVDLLWGRWTPATVTGLVVDLGEPSAAGTLRGRLARAVGDPTLVIGYWLPEQNCYVDEVGRPVDLPAAGVGRAVTPIEEGGSRVAALVHDVTVLDDPDLVSAVVSATRLAVSNARLQAEVRLRLGELESSRRRILEAADEQRRRLERELRNGAERRLERVADLLDGCGPPLTEARDILDVARSQLREFAAGIHPGALVEGGLAPAVAELAKRSPIPVDVNVSAERLPAAIEAAAYFVCSEALANVVKHSGAGNATVAAWAADRRLRVEVRDDGVGGADLSGSGLRGLADRVEAFGGNLDVRSGSGGGTHLIAEIPLP
jgi:signal transduction histidine kinase